MVSRYAVYNLVIMMPKKRRTVILILGLLSALCPFSIDMYLPAFLKIAAEFHVTVADMSLTLSSFFIGMAAGQLFYGPLLDRYGRKPPLYVALGVYLAASIGCAFSHSLPMLATFRFVQALGGCGAGIAAMAMVRDFFPPKESAQIYAFLILILGVSPLLAPTIGGFVSRVWGWNAVFVVLALICAAILWASITVLPPGHTGDAAHSLHPGAVLRSYRAILKDPQFLTHALVASLALSGLFVYVASSPIIFMTIFQVPTTTYGIIFGLLAMGFVGATQLNHVLLRHFTNEQILMSGSWGLAVTGTVFAFGSYFGWYGLTGTMVMVFLFLACFGISNPNAAALAMAPFSANAGSASSMLGFLQMAIGSVASACVGLLPLRRIFPIAAMFAASAVLALVVLTFGARQITKTVPLADDIPIGMI